MNIIDGGTPPSHPTFTYQAAPSCTNVCSGVADGTVAKQISLAFGGPASSIFAVDGSTVSYQACVPLISNACPISTQLPERWAAGPSCTGQTCTISQEVEGNYATRIQGINYWHQFVFASDYSISSGGVLCGSSPCYKVPEV